MSPFRTALLKAYALGAAAVGLPEFIKEIVPLVGMALEDKQRLVELLVKTNDERVKRGESEVDSQVIIQKGVPNSAIALTMLHFTVTSIIKSIFWPVYIPLVSSDIGVAFSYPEGVSPFFAENVTKIGAILAHAISSPFLRLNLLKQVQTLPNAPYGASNPESIRDIYRRTLVSEGSGAFLKGTGIRSIQLFMSLSIYNTFAQLGAGISSRLISRDNYLLPSLAVCFAETVTSLLFFPFISATNYRMYNAWAPADRTSITNTLSHLRRSKLLFKGSLPVSLSLGINRGLSLACMNALHAGMIWFKDQSHWTLFNTLSPVETTAMLITSSIATHTILYPLDTVVRRAQLDGMARDGAEGHIPRVYNGVISCAKDLWQKEGYRGFYRGLVVRAFERVPTIGIATYFSYTIFSNTIMKIDNDKIQFIEPEELDRLQQERDRLSSGK
eukprot:TRINITY_DN10246_c0_g1_i1.p1 TRINITY_DN10246_c0_g1~~TRINITY_DN10246_c0_g1_i1.p1  ORF type:complete len:495 (+),score=217.57 TRINITY_DN10246_c0_g1_i1:158-1486(+)